MNIYAGIDEAGYGPLFGPLVIGRTVLGVSSVGMSSVKVSYPDTTTRDNPALPDLWRTLKAAVCRQAGDRRGRLAVNDSKKLHTQAAGLKHLERGVLAFAALAGHSPLTVDAWLDALGESAHRQLTRLPWYAPCEARPWDAMPTCLAPGDCQIARAMLRHAAQRSGVTLLDLGAAVVFEDRFNELVQATRSKAAASFTFVARHLAAIWDRFGPDAPSVIVDRQSGRMRYRELLALTFPTASIRILDETPDTSAYHLTEPRPDGSPARRMTVRFEVDADGRHLPTALASMVSKYTRELLMHRFQAWFTHQLPAVKPTAGYATDAKRFWQEIKPSLGGLGIDPTMIRRMA